VSSEKALTVTRVELYRRVWSTPMRTLAKEFGLTDLELARICEKHQIPRPQVGHWVRVERGYDPEQTPLPDIEDAKLDLVNIAVREKPLDALAQDLDPKARAMLVPAPIAVQTDRSISHPLVLRTKKLLAHPRKDERGLLLPREGKPLSHIRVSEPALSRSLGILDALFRALDERNIAITWGNGDDDNLSITVFDEAVTFSISEFVQRVPHTLTADEEAKRKKGLYVYPPQWDYKLTGQLKIAINELPYDSKIRHTWSDGAIQRLENCLGALVAGLHIAALALKKQREEHLRWELEWEGRKKRAEAERRRQAEFDRKAKVISEAADAWQASNRIRDFAMALSKAGESQERWKDQGRDIRRLAKWARGYAQRLDPINRIGETVAEFKDLQESE
jgi:hypothetical protein